MISLAVKRVTFKIPKYPKKHALFLIVLRDTYSFRGANELWTFSLPRSFAPGSESSRCGTFSPWNVRSLELSLPGTFVPTNEYSKEQKFQQNV